MKAIARLMGDPYVHLLGVGVVLVRLSMGYDEDPKPIDELSAPPVCARCETDHGWGNACPDEARDAELAVHTKPRHLTR